MQDEKEYRSRPGDCLYGITRIDGGKSAGWTVCLDRVGTKFNFRCKVRDRNNKNDPERSLLRAIKVRDENINLLDGTPVIHQFAYIPRIYRHSFVPCWVVVIQDTPYTHSVHHVLDEEYGSAWDSFVASVDMRIADEMAPLETTITDKKLALEMFSKYKGVGL